MATQEKEYQKLPGKGRPPFPASLAGGSNHLWLAKDHLLKVEGNYWNERYRRFYFKDIQVFRITRDQRWIRSTVICIIALLLLGLVIFLWKELAAQVTLGTIALVPVLALIVNLVRGPSCTARIETSIGGEDLYSINRLSIAQKVLARLLPLIRNAQGEVNPSELAASIPPVLPLSFIDLPARKAALESNSIRENGRWMGWILGAMLLVTAASSGTVLAFPNFWGFPAAVVAMLVAGVLGILLMVRPIKGCGRGIAGTIVGWFCIFGILLYGLIIESAFVKATAAGPHPTVGSDYEIIMELFRQAAKPDTFMTYALIATAIISGVLGLFVLVKLFMTARE